MFGNHMAQYINHFVRIEQVWSYNLLGGLKDMDIDMRTVDDIFTKLSTFIMARHNFHLTKDAVQYNHIMHQLSEHMEAYVVGWMFFKFYFDNLFMLMSPSLGMIRYPITKVTTITTDLGLIEGFVFGT